jgi:hypothetical protein
MPSSRIWPFFASRYDSISPASTGSYSWPNGVDLELGEQRPSRMCALVGDDRHGARTDVRFLQQRAAAVSAVVVEAWTFAGTRDQLVDDLGPGDEHRLRPLDPIGQVSVERAGAPSGTRTGERKPGWK